MLQILTPKAEPMSMFLLVPSHVSTSGLGKKAVSGVAAVRERPVVTNRAGESTGNQQVIFCPMQTRQGTRGHRHTTSNCQLSNIVLQNAREDTLFISSH